jgi:hypothetical protein
MSFAKTGLFAKMEGQALIMVRFGRAALRVIVSNAGAVAARDASLASVSDNPAAPKAGIVLLRRFLFDARLMGEHCALALGRMCIR